MSDNNLDSSFDECRPLYEALRKQTEALIRNILDVRHLRYHVIESRTKSIDSFREKIGRSGKNYRDPLTDITDLCGCRIIAFYLDDCKKIAQIIKSEFEIVEEELHHQPDNLDVDRFGYISAHYIVRISAARIDLPEWAPYRGLKIEIQIRTVIQHAWSAVSHAIQYKEETKVPSSLQRRLYRIAGLFELADEEFVGIRDQRLQIQEIVATEISKGNTHISISSASLLEFLNSWKGLRKAKNAAVKAGFSINSYDVDHSVISYLYQIASRNGLTTIGEVEQVLDLRNISIFNKLMIKYRELRDDPIIRWSVTPDFIVLLLLFCACSFRSLATFAAFCTMVPALPLRARAPPPPHPRPRRLLSRLAHQPPAPRAPDFLHHLAQDRAFLISSFQKYPGGKAAFHLKSSPKGWPLGPP